MAASASTVNSTATLTGPSSAQLVRQAITESIRKSSKSREEIAEEMSQLSGFLISARMLNRYTAETGETYFPSILIDPLCRATNDDRLKRLILGPELAQLLQLGEYVATLLPDESARRRLLPIASARRNRR